MTNISTETLIDVRYVDTDQMGIVHHSNYVVYLELSRIDWLNKLGFSYQKMEKEGVMLPVVSLNLKYQKSAFFGDQLTVKTVLKKIPNIKIEFAYEIYNQKEELLTTGETILVFMDAKNRKIIKCPESILMAITNYSEIT